MVVLLKNGLLETVLQSQSQSLSKTQKASKDEILNFRYFLKRLPEEFQKECLKIILKNNKVLNINTIMQIEKTIFSLKQSLFCQIKMNHSFSKITRESLYFQISNTQNLKELNISYCAKLQDKDVLSILSALKSNSPNLEILNYSGLTISDNTLIKTLEYFPFLKSISINDCSVITDAGINELINWITNNNQLHALSIAGLAKISPDLLIQLLSILKNIEGLNISRLIQLNELHLSNILDRVITNNPLLTSFEAAETNLNLSHLKIIENAQKLIVLNLNKCSGIEQDALNEFFDFFESIQQLSLSGLPVNNAILKKILVRNGLLHSLDIENCSKITDLGFVEACLHFSRFRNRLCNINFANLKINAKSLNSGFNILFSSSSLKKVEKIDLSNSPINLEILSKIAFCSNVKHLSLAGVKILDEHLATFFKEFGKNNCKLKTLNLNSVIFKGNSFGLKTFSSITKNFKTIRHITIKGSNLREFTVFTPLAKKNLKFTSLFFDIPGGILNFEKESREAPNVIPILEHDPLFFPKSNQILIKNQSSKILKTKILSIDIIGKEWLKKVCSKMKSIDFYGNWSLNSSKLNSVIKTQKNIESLDLSMTCLSNADIVEAIHLLKEFSPNLQFLSLQRLPLFNETVLLIFESFPNLKGIDLSNLSYVDDDIGHSFIQWIKNNSNLQSLGLPTSLSPELIEDIIEATSHLNVLSIDSLSRSISFNYEKAENILKSLSLNSPKLKKLNLAHTYSFANFIKNLPDYFPGLVDLTLPGLRIENCGKIIAKWSNLKVLKFFMPSKEDFIEIAENNIQLTHLSLLTLDNLDDDAFKMGLEIIGKKNTPLEALQFTARALTSTISSEAYLQGLENIKNILPTIKWLQLDSSNFDDHCLALLAEHCMNLRQLNISGSKITGEGFLKNMSIIGDKNPIEYLSMGLTDLGGTNSPSDILEILIHNFHNLKFLSICSGIGLESQIICEKIPLIVQANPNIQSISVFQSVDNQDLENLLKKYPEIAPLVINAPDFSKGALSCQWEHGYGVRRC